MTTNETPKKNVPELRFPGFENAWTPTLLGEHSQITTGRLDANAMVKGGAYPFFTCAREVYQIDIAAFDTDALLISGNGANVGYIHRYRGKFNAYQRTYVLDEFDTDIEFVRYVLERDLKRRIFDEVKSGNTPYIVKSTLSEMSLALPEAAEQRKIAASLDAVTEKIVCLTKKKTLLEDYKKGCVQQIFSQTIRFRDDQNHDFPDWEEKRLGEVVELCKGKGISKDDIAHGGETPCIRYGEVYTDYSERIADIKSRTNVPVSALKLSEKGDVIIPASGEDRLDMARACCVELGGVALGGDLNILRGAPNGSFLAYYLSHTKKREIARIAQGYSVVHLYGSQLLPLEICLPCVGEQKKIVSFISSIDAKIELMEREFQQAQTFKKGLLQQMFV